MLVSKLPSGVASQSGARVVRGRPRSYISRSWPSRHTARVVVRSRSPPSRRSMSYVTSTVSSRPQVGQYLSSSFEVLMRQPSHLAVDPDHVFTKLLGKRLRHRAHPSSANTPRRRPDVTYPCSRPPCGRVSKQVRRSRVAALVHASKSRTKGSSIARRVQSTPRRRPPMRNHASQNAHHGGEEKSKGTAVCRSHRRSDPNRGSGLILRVTTIAATTVEPAATSPW